MLLARMFERIEQIIQLMNFDEIPEHRKSELSVLIDYIESRRLLQEPINLNFICTHNSRRSQFSQLWAKVASDHYGIAINSFSGGVEVTSFNSRALDSLMRFGFHVTRKRENNPVYSVSWSEESEPLLMFSKLYNDQINPSGNFAAVMTCSDADENCPIIHGCDARLAIRYEDPKKYDDTPLESLFYDYRSLQIANELFYVFSRIKQ